MELVNGRDDYEYFSRIWEFKKTDGLKHTAEKWDGRADDWGKELAQAGPFRQSVDERVIKAANYLRGKGLLGSDSNVIDIGCGPGRFVSEFAKTAGHVTGVDLSPRMLELGRDHARELKLDNVTYLSGDFKEMEISDWNKQFDLVFTSITPAIGTLESLKKVMEISRGYCFNSCFIHWEDELERQIAHDVYEREYSPSQGNHGAWFYALFNLLWLEGYFPETQYHHHNQRVLVSVTEDLARYYARSFSGNLTVNDVDVKRIFDYLKDRANGQDTIEQYTKRWYGWILWDVRIRTKKMPKRPQEV